MVVVVLVVLVVLDDVVDVLVVFGYCNQYADLGLPVLVPGPSESPVIEPKDPIGPLRDGPPIPPVFLPPPIGILTHLLMGLSLLLLTRNSYSLSLS